MGVQEHYLLVLTEEFERRCRTNARYSIRAYARALGLNPGALSQVLSGKRVPSVKMAGQIADALGLSPTERQIFMSSLAAHQRSRGLKRLSQTFRKMPVTVAPPREIKEEHFNLIADPLHYAILELTFVNDFRPEPKWIAAQLGAPVNEVKLAIDRLLRTGLLARAKGTLVKAEAQITTPAHHATTPAFRLHQRKILQKALESLENDPIESRCMHSMTMAVDPTKLAEAKQMIREFTRELCRFLEDGDRTSVFEFATALYPLQKEKSKC